MKKKLSYVKEALYHYNSKNQLIRGLHEKLYFCEGSLHIWGNCTYVYGFAHSDLSGDVSNLTGDISELRGNATGICGDCSLLKGNFDECEITDRSQLINIADLIAD